MLQIVLNIRWAGEIRVHLIFRSIYISSNVYLYTIQCGGMEENIHESIVEKPLQWVCVVYPCRPTLYCTSTAWIEYSIHEHCFSTLDYIVSKRFGTESAMNGSLLLFGLCRGRQFMTGWMDSMYGVSCTTTVAAGVDRQS